MPLTDVSGKAKALYEARRNRQAIEPFTDADPDLGMADGYAIAQQLTAMLVSDGDTVIGYKVGLTSKPMQQMIGVDSPDHGPVLGSTVYADGDAVSLSHFIQPKIEAEIAFVLGSPLRGPGVTVLEARRAIAGMAAAMEIVDSRFADVDTGAGAAALGDPVAVVAWLAKTLGEMGASLEAGQLIMTGALHAAVPMLAGDVYRAEFDRLGPVTIRVVE